MKKLLSLDLRQMDWKGQFEFLKKTLLNRGLDIAPLRGREREALVLLPEERREKALRIRREDARLRSIGAALLLREAGIEPPFSYGGHGKPRLCFRGRPVSS